MSSSLTDIALENEKKISFFIERQFPSIYRENGRELVDLVKSYYRFLEEHQSQSIYNIRRIYEYRNIDTTLDRMLLFFKNKFLNGLFFDRDVRFIVKNILDLYRRKGSKEGIELFFRMFFDTEIEVYYPSFDMFKPSESSWKVGSFIQLYPVKDLNIFNGIINRRIYGDRSKAEAFVDNIYIININETNIPVLLISGIKGRFVGFDTIYSLESSTTTVYGEIYGSLHKVEIDRAFPQATGNNRVGDVVTIETLDGRPGVGAKARVSKVTADLTGELNLIIRDGLYGYTIANTDIIISNQTVFMSEEAAQSFIINERIVQRKQEGDSYALVVGKRRNAIGIKLEEQSRVVQRQTSSVTELGSDLIRLSSVDEVLVNQVVSLAGIIPGNTKVLDVDTVERIVTLSNPVTDFIVAGTEITFTSNLLFEVSNDPTYPIETVDRQQNITHLPVFVTRFNNSASASVGSLVNTEEIRIITDVIENFLNVPLDSTNYSEIPPAIEQMSGTRVNGVIPTLVTPLNVAFVPENFIIGEMGSLSGIAPGFDYDTDPFVLAKENMLHRFNRRNQVITYTSQPGVVFSVNDEIIQQKTITLFEGGTAEVDVRGKIVGIEGNTLFVKQKTFESFVSNRPFRKKNSNVAVNIIALSRDIDSLPLGLNAIIDADVEIVSGKILEVEIIDTGLGYENGSLVGLINTSKIERENTQIEDNVYDAQGIAFSRGQGFTEGRWVTFKSHTNIEKKLQDSFFYQDYSYEISTDVTPEIYEETYKELIHPSGVKLFTSFSRVDVVDTKSTILGPFITKYALEETDLLEETGLSYISENGFQYLNTNLVEVE
jgi:hypothetical protein